MQMSDSFNEDDHCENRKPTTSNNRPSLITFNKPGSLSSNTGPVVNNSEETADEDYPLKFTSTYSIDSAYPSALQKLTSQDVSVSNVSNGEEEEPNYRCHVSKLGPKRRVADILTDFCGRTSSHGIPHVGTSRSLIGKLFWTIIFLACSVAFIIHTYYTVRDYLEYSVILRMQLKFNAVPFPAVTVCNLNPYKASVIKNNSIFEDRIFGFSDNKVARRLRKRQVLYEVVYAKCQCLKSTDDECVPIADKGVTTAFTTCLCYLDVQSNNIWPCYDALAWTQHRCTECSTSNACPFPPKAADVENGEIDDACLCQNISRFCVKRHSGPIRYWDGYYFGIGSTTTSLPTTSPTPYTDEDSSVEFQEMLTYYISTLDEAERRNLSYSLDEFIILCSFNGARCVKERDFRLEGTPRHGNCYTFNHNSTVNLINSRAGPLYGLRLLLNVDQSEYLNYIEGAGVRVVVHHQNQYPFPDTFGYSAPTGAISSFGLKYKQFKRKGYPWSKCTLPETVDKTNYLFKEEYSTEGCYRSCVQKLLVDSCSCASYRFPRRNHSLCNYLEPTFKKCMNRLEEAVNKNNSCTCLQPCSEPVYQTSYSAASWPAQNFHSFNAEHCKIALILNQSCIEYNRKNTAFIEVFYEQLNYEMLTEVEAYSIFNLFADFGGNIGLWIGFSTITVVEFLELALELLYHCYYVSTKPIARKLSKTKSELGMQYVNRIGEQSYPVIDKEDVEESSFSSPVGNHSSSAPK